jgi:hypothetical protein
MSTQIQSIRFASYFHVITSLAPFRVRTHLRVLAALAALLCAAGCAGERPDAPPTHVEIKIGYVACTTVTDDTPNDDCAPGQTAVKRCTQATDNPNEAQCTGPVGSETQAAGKVWCCVP